MASIVINGDTSGSVTLQAPAIAGSTVVTLPTVSMNMGTGGGSVATNTAFGASALAANTTGSQNTAVGASALASNTTGSTQTAIGYQAGFSGTTSASSSSYVGYQAGYANTGDAIDAFGYQSLLANTTGGSNVGLGVFTLKTNTTGSYNTAVGRQALQANTTASNNTAVGFQAGYSNTTSSLFTAIGYQAGYSYNHGAGDVTTLFCGSRAGYSQTSGIYNTYVGEAAGYSMTTGAKNTILGRYTGNQGGLDIRTASNNIVLSDGDGNPQGLSLSTGSWFLGIGTRSEDGLVNALALASNNTGPVFIGRTGAHGSTTARWYAGSNSWIKGGTAYDTYTVAAGAGASGGVSLTSGATSWASASDERLKDIIEPITDAANKVSQLRAVIGKYKTDEEGTRRPFLIAQDVQAVLPEAVTEGRNSKDDETEYLQVAYTEVIPLLVAAIKEQQALITTLTTRITALETP